MRERERERGGGGRQTHKLTDIQTKNRCRIMFIISCVVISNRHGCGAARQFTCLLRIEQMTI